MNASSGSGLWPMRTVCITRSSASSTPCSRCSRAKAITGPMADVDARLESLVRRERALTLAALAVLVALAWIYFVRLGRGMTAMAATPFVAAVLLIVAAIYQVTPLKYACLARCRTPLGFLMTEWREGPAGAFVMGLRHGLFCLGCCWALMTLLFVGGVMNLAWVAAIASFVLVEKLVPAGRVVSWLSGGALLAWGRSEERRVGKEGRWGGWR